MRWLCLLLSISCCVAMANPLSKTSGDRLRPDHSMQELHPSESPKFASDGFRIIEEQIELWDEGLAKYVNHICIYYYYYSESGLLWGEFSQTWDGSNFSNGEFDFYRLYSYVKGHLKMYRVRAVENVPPQYY